MFTTTLFWSPCSICSLQSSEALPPRHGSTMPQMRNSLMPHFNQLLPDWSECPCVGGCELCVPQSLLLSVPRWDPQFRNMGGGETASATFSCARHWEQYKICSPLFFFPCCCRNCLKYFWALFSPFHSERKLSTVVCSSIRAALWRHGTDRKRYFVGVFTFWQSRTTFRGWSNIWHALIYLGVCAWLQDAKKLCC